MERVVEEDERPRVLENISNTTLPVSDLLFGKEGPLSRSWTGNH